MGTCGEQHQRQYTLDTKFLQLPPSPLNWGGEREYANINYGRTIMSAGYQSRREHSSTSFADFLFVPVLCLHSPRCAAYSIIHISLSGFAQSGETAADGSFISYQILLTSTKFRVFLRGPSVPSSAFAIFTLHSIRVYLIRCCEYPTSWCIFYWNIFY